uniref:FLYWCH-type domain-containing protein n=1 Tax=Acrobeloides nanus TaxID=290746 RepID=A0A914DSF4_9BILA
MAARKLKIYETCMASKNKQFGRKAILDSHVYCFNRGYGTLDGCRCQWICSHKGCNVTLLADSDGNIKKEPRDHLHYPPDAASREANIQVGKLKKNAKETAAKTSEVVDEVRNNVSIAILGRMPSKQSLLQQVQRSRKEELNAPANPTNFVNLVIPHKFSVHQKRDSMGGAELVEERFLQSEIPVADKKILIFARQKFMNLLEDTVDWLIKIIKG